MRLTLLSNRELSYVWPVMSTIEETPEGIGTLRSCLQRYKTEEHFRPMLPTSNDHETNLGRLPRQQLFSEDSVNSRLVFPEIIDLKFPRLFGCPPSPLLLERLLSSV